MMNDPRLCLVVGLSLVSLGSGYEYQCDPGTDPTVCSVWNFEYNRTESPLPSINISASVKKVRLVIEQYYNERRLGITLYDAVLHSTILHNPIAVHLTQNRVSELHIPTDLQIGEFQHNYIGHVLTDSNKSYALAYLDLMYNNLQDISNLTALVNLRTLNLEGNRCRELNSSTFTGMHNLSMLYLGYNDIHKLDFKAFPKGLTNLWLLRNWLGELNFTGVSLPALDVLDLERNNLATIDLPALFAACPALRSLPIAMNPMAEGEAKRIVAELKRHNVTHYFGQPWSRCDSDEYEVSSICFPGSVLISRSVWKAFVLFVLAVVLVVAFVGSVRWIWYQMRY